MARKRADSQTGRWWRESVPFRSGRLRSFLRANL